MMAKNVFWLLACAVGALSCRSSAAPAVGGAAERSATVYVNVLSMRHASSEMQEIISVNGERVEARAPRIYEGPGQSPRVLSVLGGVPADFTLGVRYVGPRPSHWSTPLIQHWLSAGDVPLVGFAHAVVTAARSNQVITTCEQDFSFRPTPGASYRVEYRLASDNTCAIRCVRDAGGPCEELHFIQGRPLPEPTAPADLTTLATLLNTRGVQLDSEAPNGTLVVAHSDADQLRAGDELVDLGCDDRFGAMRVHHAPSGVILNKRLCQPRGTLVARLRRQGTVDSVVLRAAAD